MLVALAVLAALETAPSPAAVELTRSGSAGAPVSAGPRTLSDVAREMREGRQAVGGFSAVETTVSPGPRVLPVVEWFEEETRSEPEVVPESRPPEGAVPYVSEYGGWNGGGGWGGGPHRRPPHVSHHGSSARPGRQPGAGASPRGGDPQASRSAARSSAVGAGTRIASPRR